MASKNVPCGNMEHRLNRPGRAVQINRAEHRIPSEANGLCTYLSPLMDTKVCNHTCGLILMDDCDHSRQALEINCKPVSNTKFLRVPNQIVQFVSVDWTIYNAVKYLVLQSASGI